LPLFDKASLFSILRTLGLRVRGGDFRVRGGGFRVRGGVFRGLGVRGFRG
jgi:hypothetical protein